VIKETYLNIEAFQSNQNLNELLITSIVQRIAQWEGKKITEKATEIISKMTQDV
jgi:hypothetical protein